MKPLLIIAQLLFCFAVYAQQDSLIKELDQQVISEFNDSSLVNYRFSAGITIDKEGIVSMDTATDLWERNQKEKLFQIFKSYSNKLLKNHWHHFSFVWDYGKLHYNHSYSEIDTVDNKIYSFGPHEYFPEYKDKMSNFLNKIISALHQNIDSIQIKDYYEPIEILIDTKGQTTFLNNNNNELIPILDTLIFNKWRPGIYYASGLINTVIKIKILNKNWILNNKIDSKYYMEFLSYDFVLNELFKDQPIYFSNTPTSDGITLISLMVNHSDNKLSDLLIHKGDPIQGKELIEFVLKLSNIERGIPNEDFYNIHRMYFYLEN
jgi:hypothetical protein